jgi:hypothetical protein
VWDQSPAEFTVGLELARDFLDRHPTKHPVVTVNAWNEWTEGSYLPPDTTHERFPGSDPQHVRNSVAASVADQPTDAPTMRAGLRDRDAG